MKLTEQEMKLMEKYELTEQQIATIRAQVALDDIRGARAQAAAEAKAAAELVAAKESEKDSESGNDFEIQ